MFKAPASPRTMRQYAAMGHIPQPTFVNGIGAGAMLTMEEDRRKDEEAMKKELATAKASAKSAQAELATALAALAASNRSKSDIEVELHRVQAELDQLRENHASYSSEAKTAEIECQTDWKVQTVDNGCQTLVDLQTKDMECQAQIDTETVDKEGQTDNEVPPSDKQSQTDIRVEINDTESQTEAGTEMMDKESQTLSDRPSAGSECHASDSESQTIFTQETDITITEIDGSSQAVSIKKPVKPVKRSTSARKLCFTQKLFACFGGIDDDDVTAKEDALVVVAKEPEVQTVSLKKRLSVFAKKLTLTRRQRSHRATIDGVM